MSNIESAVRNTLISDGDVTALVATRVYWQNVPTTAALPYIFFALISEPAITHQAGVVNLAEARVQVDCVAATAASVRAVSDAADAALTDARGELGPAGDKTTVRRIRAEGDTHQIDDPDDGSQDSVHRAVQDYMVAYRPT